jgi:hypothetical protein
MSGALMVTKLTSGVISGYVEVPPDWSAQTAQFSGELFLKCPSCAKSNISMPTPIVLSPEQLEEVRRRLPKRPK